MAEAGLRTEGLSDELVDWLEEADLDFFEVRVKNFHRYLREETEISSGSTINYVKKMYGLLEEHGCIEDVPKEYLDQRERSAYNKYAEYLENTDKTSKSGEKQR